uniref:Uncharacterized protein n=1 Tax=Cucumis melo TaxID=3656 RepID=A0A9I9EKP2_CUCME
MLATIGVSRSTDHSRIQSAICSLCSSTDVDSVSLSVQLKAEIKGNKLTGLLTFLVNENGFNGERLRKVFPESIEAVKPYLRQFIDV